MEHVIDGVTYNPKFEDGEKVLCGSEIVTVRYWNYAPNVKRYTYSIVEYPSTFAFEEELKKLDEGANPY